MSIRCFSGMVKFCLFRILEESNQALLNLEADPNELTIA